MTESGSALLRQLTWEQLWEIREAEEELIEADNKVRDAQNERDFAQETVDRLKLELGRVQQRIKAEVMATECTAIPPRGTLIYHVIDKVAYGDDKPDYPCLLDSSERMRAAIVKDSNFGRAIRFRADADGPTLCLTENGETTLITDMMRGTRIRDHVPRIMYRAGALLEWRRNIPGPAPMGSRVAIDHRDFGSEGASLRLVKEENDVALHENMVYEESALDYTIINGSGFPRKRADYLAADITLEPITGQVVSVEPMCSALSWLPEGAESRVEAILARTEARRWTVYLTPDEIAILIEPQVKSAAKKQ